MSSGKQSKKKSQQLNFDSMVKCLRSTMAGFPDIRTGSNFDFLTLLKPLIYTIQRYNI